MRVNVDATRRLLDACRARGHRPRLVFASSVAVFGGDMPDVGLETTALTPQTSYGTEKAIGELLVNDASRRGFVDGRVLPAADDQRPPGPAERRRLVVCQRHLSRARERRGLDLSRRSCDAGRPGVAGGGHRQHDRGARSSGRAPRLEPDRQRARAFGHRRRNGQRARACRRKRSGGAVRWERNAENRAHGGGLARAGRFDSRPSRSAFRSTRTLTP